jgi:hypothetical protein
MGERRLFCALAMLGTVALGCEEPLPPQERIDISASDRSCKEDEACGVVETSCRSTGCECGVAVNESSLLHYQQKLAECRGQNPLATCDFECKTPFGKCFNGACVLTDEPQELFRRGRSVQQVCEKSRGEYVGCPECPPNTRCKSCVPCVCPSTHRWTSKGCSQVVQAEARDIPIETRPSRLTLSDKVKTRINNHTRRKIWLKTVCGTPFYRARKKQDEWEKDYEPFGDVKCRVGSIALKPGESRPFVIRNLSKFKGPDGGTLTPGTYRFEVTYTDNPKSFRHHGLVYSGEFDLTARLSSR